MFKQYKQNFEKWLRSIVRDEVASEVAGAVSSINTSLDAERRAFCNLTKSAECTINLSLASLSQLAHFKENAELRKHINDLGSRFAEIKGIAESLQPKGLTERLHRKASTQVKVLSSE